VTTVGFAVGAPPFAPLRAQITRLRQGGIGGFWWADHLLAFHSRALWAQSPVARSSPDPHRYADPFICMAACAESAGDALIGVSVTDAVRRMPATLVQTAMTIDYLSQGPVVIGLGSGEAANYRPYGWDVQSPAARLADATMQIRALLDDPGPHEHGEVMGLRPPEGSRGPQLWLGTHGPKGYELTGRFADGWLPHLLDREGWLRGRDAVLGAAARHGRDPDSLTLALSRGVVITEDHETAHEILEHPVLKAFALLLPPDRFEAAGVEHPLGSSAVHHLVASTAGDELTAAAGAGPSEVIRSHFLHGTVDDVIAQIAEYPELGHVLLWDATALADLAAAKTSIVGCQAVARAIA